MFIGMVTDYIGALPTPPKTPPAHLMTSSTPKKKITLLPQMRFWLLLTMERIEPDLQDYVGFYAEMMKFPIENTNIALYDDFFTQR